jgi:hypothetical protein
VSHGICQLRFIGDIDILLRVGQVIEKHFTAAGPFCVEIAVGFDGFGRFPLAENGLFPRLIRIMQQRCKTFALEGMAGRYDRPANSHSDG